VLISTDDLDALEETISILGDEKSVRELREAERAIAEGDAVRGIESVRALRAR
jgi:PHD/YefM family antitoxin component YafN of YafNO toxin-antitoxin module